MSEATTSLTSAVANAGPHFGREAATQREAPLREATADWAGPERTARRLRGLRLVLWVAGGLGVAALSTGWSVWNRMSTPSDSLVFYAAARGNLAISLTERGNLESQQQTIIRCEVENLATNGNGTQILTIVPNGKAVEAGELLVELDAAPLRERLDTQVLGHEKATAEHIQAKAKLDNQITQNDIRHKEAQLKVELAELDLAMYGDDKGGTYRIALGELNLKIEEAFNQIAESMAALELQRTERDGIELLYKLGYRGKGDRSQARYKYMQAEDNMARAANVHSNAKNNRKKLEDFERRMKMLELKGALDTAKGNLKQAIVDNESQLAQATATETAAERSLKKEKERLDKYRELLEKCKIKAPHAGMAVYFQEQDFRGGSSTIGEGALVRERQNILTLPNLNSMQVKTTVHESVLDQVKTDLPVTVKIDAFPDRAYRGRVKNVAVLPRQGNWLSSDIKVYETIVTIDESVEQLKPGMTAVVEIHVDVLKDVISVPVQSIVQVGSKIWCFVGVSGTGEVEKRPIKLGRSNDKFVEVLSGIDAGDQVVLNPMALVDEGGDADSEEEPPEPAPSPGAAPAGANAAAPGGPNAAKPGGPAGPPGAGGRGGDPMAADKDGDGKISREEAPEQLRGLFDRLDANKDGSIDAAELQSMRGRGRGGKSAGGGPPGASANNP